jgi:GST-like protein
MLEECSLPYSVHGVDISAGQQFEPAFLAISPNNRMPAIVDPEGPDGLPVSVFESGVILQYLANKTGRFGGDTPREKAAVSEWLFWQMGVSDRWPAKPITSASVPVRRSLTRSTAIPTR